MSLAVGDRVQPHEGESTGTLEHIRASKDGYLVGEVLRDTGARGQESGVAIDTSAAWVAQFHGGLIARFRTYTDRGEALEAAGLSE